MVICYNSLRRLRQRINLPRWQIKYACNKRKKTLKNNVVQLRRETDKSTTKVRDSISLIQQLIEKTKKKKNSKDIDNSNQPPKYNWDLWIIHPTVAECTFFLSAQRAYAKIEYMLAPKTNVSTLKRTEVTQCFLIVMEPN